MPFTVIRQDITNMKVDVIVNAANINLLCGGGVCGAIFDKAGKEEMTAACSKLAPINYGKAVITPAFQLPCKYVIHTAGPMYNQAESEKCEVLLYSAYINSLELAKQYNCASIAFPLISSGIYRYPKHLAFSVATKAIKDFLKDNDLNIYLAVFDKTAFEVSQQLIGNVKKYVDENYVTRKTTQHRRIFNVDISKNTTKKQSFSYSDSQEQTSLFAKIDIELDEPFNMSLLRLIDAKGKTDTEIYKKANIDRKLFSKIRTGKGYVPSKRTIIALAIALELTLTETETLLKQAGYAFSHSNKFDVIIEYFIFNGKYDIYEINDVLFQFDQPQLGI